MFQSATMLGRPISETEIAQIRGLPAENGRWSRWRLSVHLAQMGNWRSAGGQLKDMAARTLLL